MRFCFPLPTEPSKQRILRPAISSDGLQKRSVASPGSDLWIPPIPDCSLYWKNGSVRGASAVSFSTSARMARRFLVKYRAPFIKIIRAATKAAVIIRDITDRKRVEETLRHITEGTAGSTGDEFFRSLVKHLARALQVRYSFVAECTDETKKNVRMLAFWQGEDFGNNIEFPLAGTPCESVIQGNVCSYPERLQVLFPEDEGLVALGAQSYAGVPLVNRAGNILGHLVVIDDKPRVFSEQAFSFLRIFATRAGAELERKHAATLCVKARNVFERYSISTMPSSPS